MKKLFTFVLILSGIYLNAQQTQVIEYGYNQRGELHLIIQGADSLINFYDASGNRITESQNIWSIPDAGDPGGDRFLNCYPNPTADQITILFELPEEMDYTIKLFNQAGQFQKQISSEKKASGRKEISLSLGNLSDGIYYLWFYSPQISKVRKIIKL